MRLLFLLILASPLLGQMRVIPHLTRLDGGFVSRVIVNNLSANSQNYTLYPYNEAGHQLENVSGSLEGFESVVLHGITFEEGASHVYIDAPDSVEFLVSYQDINEYYSPAHAPCSKANAKRFRLFPGNWSDVIDGLALVNTGESEMDFRITQKDASGMTISEQVVGENIPPQGKSLVLLDQFFFQQPGAYFELDSDEPVAITFLRFAKSCPYFWSTPVVTLEDLDPKIGMTADLVGKGNYGISGTAEITDERTITITNFNYTGDGVVVQVYGGLGGNYGQGFAMSGDLIRSTPYVNETIVCQLPEGKTLMDLDGISIWCVAAGVDFGSGFFQ